MAKLDSKQSLSKPICCLLDDRYEFKVDIDSNDDTISYKHAMVEIKSTKTKRHEKIM